MAVEVQHYFVGGGAEHSAEQVRRLVFGHQQGAEGVCEPGDLRVYPATVPGGSVRVVTGSAFIVSNAPGAVREMYFGTVVKQQSVTIPQNSSAARRSDLIVMRVRDPYVQGSVWNDPGATLSDPAAAEAARAAAQYIFIERISSVPAGTKRLQDVAGFEHETAYTLARIDIPGATGTITSEMIVDLRHVHTRRIMDEHRLKALVSGEQETLVATGQRGEWFPSKGGVQYIDVPVWATRMQVEAEWIAVNAGPGNSRGYCWVEYGDGVGGNADREFATQYFLWDAPNTANDSKVVPMKAIDDRKVDPKLRGKTVPFITKARISSASTPASRPVLGADAGVSLKVRFYNDALSVSDS